MTKIRSFGIVLAAAAGIALAGGGLASAQDETPAGTGSAEALPALIELLSTGSAGAGTETPAGNTAQAIQDEEPGTGSAEGLPALLQALITGSAGAETPGTGAGAGTN
ncbi:hypothetical protein [Nocardia sp. NPDC057353]|uniref:hypothetical protein n=1 Tax=Nocardia sp. NPDC057353 TaxID=3346104 RepID=UPI003627D8E6